MKVPEKHASQWSWIGLIFALIIFSLIILAQTMLNSVLTARSISSFGIIALVTAMIGSMVGYLGGKLFFSIYAIGAFLGVLYMLYIAAFNTSPGWGDLTSLIGFIFILAVGAAGGLAAEVFSFWAKKRRAK